MIFGLLTSGCCLSPRWRGCGLDDIAETESPNGRSCWTVEVKRSTGAIEHRIICVASDVPRCDENSCGKQPEWIVQNRTLLVANKKEIKP